jgi:chorismate synthase
MEIYGYLCQMGEKKPTAFHKAHIEQNAFFWPNNAQEKELEKYLHELRAEHGSVGAAVRVVATNAPAGLGEPIFDRLDADIAKALMSINAVKGVEIGDGMAVAGQLGAGNRDEMDKTGFLSNHAGGILGGISSGQNIVATIALKPTSSMHIPGKSLDIHGNEVEVVTKGRHDPCVGIRATPIAEAMLAMTLMDHALRHRGQCG